MDSKEFHSRIDEIERRKLIARKEIAKHKYELAVMDVMIDDIYARAGVDEMSEVEQAADRCSPPTPKKTKREIPEELLAALKAAIVHPEPGHYASAYTFLFGDDK